MFKNYLEEISSSYKDLFFEYNSLEYGYQMICKTKIKVKMTK